MKDIWIILLSVLLNVAAQLLIRSGMLSIGNITIGDEFIKALPSMLLNYKLWLAMFSYVLSFAIWMVVLSKYEVSFAYPFIALGFALITICGYIFFNETISWLKILGIGLICLGVLCVGKTL
ncbi:MAG: EamA family transporter [Helicobacteraceae bacterium]|jgi:multidrug transporter EmrE-like cation transporter|nr:EamA family transporter [Helicobacteraceae bacterium]